MEKILAPVVTFKPCAIQLDIRHIVMTRASIEKSGSKQPLHNHAFQVTTIVTFHTSNRSKSMILSMYWVMGTILL